MLAKTLKCHPMKNQSKHPRLRTVFSPFPAHPQPTSSFPLSLSLRFLLWRLGGQPTDGCSQPPARPPLGRCPALPGALTIAGKGCRGRGRLHQGLAAVRLGGWPRQQLRQPPGGAGGALRGARGGLVAGNGMGRAGRLCRAEGLCAWGASSSRHRRGLDPWPPPSCRAAPFRP